MKSVKHITQLSNRPASSSKLKRKQHEGELTKIQIEDVQQRVKRIVKTKTKVSQVGIWNNQVFILSNENKVVFSELLDLQLTNPEVKFQLHQGFKGYKIKSLAFGISHMIALTLDGVALGLGSNENGQLAHAKKEESIKYEPQALIWFIQNNIRVKDVYCGDHQSFFVASDGQTMFQCGQNDAGQLGFDQSKQINQPRQVGLEIDAPVIDLQSGSTFSAILTGNGKVYMSGSYNLKKISCDFSEIKTPNIEIKQIRVLRSLLLALDSHNQMLLFNEDILQFEIIVFLKPIQVVDFQLQTNSNILIKDKKGILYLADFISQSINQITSTGVDRFFKNSSHLVFTQNVPAPKVNETMVSSKQSLKVQTKQSTSTYLSSKSMKHTPKNNDYSSINSITPQNKGKKKISLVKEGRNQKGPTINISKIIKSVNFPSEPIQSQQPAISLFDSIKKQAQIQQLQQQLLESESEKAKLKVEIEKMKAQSLNDQKLLSMLCQNLDEFQKPLGCKQCQINAIEMKNLQSTVDLQQDRIDSLQQEIAASHQQFQMQQSQSLISNPLNTVNTTCITASVGPGAVVSSNRLVLLEKAAQKFFELQNIPNILTTQSTFEGNKENLPYRNLDLIKVNAGFNTVQVNQPTSNHSQSFCNQEPYVPQSRNSFAKKYSDREVEPTELSQSFDEFLTKSAHKLKSIMKDSSAKKSLIRSPISNFPNRFSEDRENMRPFDNSPSINSTNYASGRDPKRISLQNFRDKLQNLQRNKEKLKERIGSYEKQLRNSAVL